MDWTIPDDLVRRLRDRVPDGGPDGHTWLSGLTAVVDERRAAWGLSLDGPAMNGHNALVLPVRRDDRPMVLKVTWPHPEAAHEHLGLRHWAGRGAVQMIAADPGSSSLLLERLGPGDLAAEPEADAVGVLGSLLRRLHVQPPPSVPLFRQATASWFAPLRSHPGSIPRRWVDRALEVYDHREDPVVLLHGDLHFLNVLAGEREPWLAIDPKPMAGPAAFDLYPLLANRVEDYGNGSGFRAAVRWRLECAAEAAGVDLTAARDWGVAHAVVNAYDYGQDGWPTLTTLNLAIAKAIDDL